MLKNKISFFNTFNSKILFLIILSTITLQTIYFIAFQNKHGELGYTTESYYQDTAINLITYKSYSQGDPPINTAHRPPLYPITLAAIYTVIGEYPKLAIIVNNLFIIISLFTTYLIGKKISYSIGIISAILFVLPPLNTPPIPQRTKGTINIPTKTPAIFVFAKFLILFNIFWSLNLLIYKTQSYKLNFSL